MKTDLKKHPKAYFITFTTYGARLHGDERGTVNKKRNNFCSSRIPACQKLLQSERHLQNHPKVVLNPSERKTVLTEIIKTCKVNGWELFAAHVRTNHVHVVVYADKKPEEVMRKIKAYATRKLRVVNGLNDKKYWASHGSTRYLWNYMSVWLVMKYVVEEQGAMMDCFYDKEWCKDFLD